MEKAVSRGLGAAMTLDQIFWKHPPLSLQQALLSWTCKESSTNTLGRLYSPDFEDSCWNLKATFLSVDADDCILWLAIAIGRRAPHTSWGMISISSGLPAIHTSIQTVSPQVFIYSLFYVSDAPFNLCRVSSAWRMHTNTHAYTHTHAHKEPLSIYSSCTPTQI